jgi:hypothetical protein
MGTWMMVREAVVVVQFFLTPLEWLALAGYLVLAERELGRRAGAGFLVER